MLKMQNQEKPRFKWFYVGLVPILMPERNVARQFEIEFWLDSKPILNALGLKTPEQIADEKRRMYVV